MASLTETTCVIRRVDGVPARRHRRDAWTPPSGPRSRHDSHETQGLSHGHVDGAAVAWRRADAIDATLRFRKHQKQTLSQYRIRKAPE